MSNHIGVKHSYPELPEHARTIIRDTASRRGRPFSSLRLRKFTGRPFTIHEWPWRLLGCLNETLLSSLGHARVVLAEWRHDYNYDRPHSSLGNITPAEIAAQSEGKPSWGLTPNPVVAFTPNPGHQNGQGLYFYLVGSSGSDQILDYD